MTKEEMKQEAEEKYHNHKIVDFQGFYNRHYYYLGYVESAEPREKRIAELEAQIEQNKIDVAILEHDREHNDYELTEVYTKLEQLEKENAKLKCNCRTCVYTDSPCVRSDYPSKDGVCSHYKNVFEEKAELIKENKVLAQNLEDTEILNKTYEKRFSDLEKENAELKKLFADCDTCKRTCDIGNCCKFGSDYLPDVEKVLNEQKQLTNAKEIIKKLKALYLSPVVTKDDVKRQDEILEEVEQFLNSEVEK